MNNLQIRWWVRRNLAACLEIERLSFADPWDEFHFEHVIGQREAVPMVAEIDSKVVGFMIYMVRSDHIEIETLSVHPEFRRCGIGKRMADRVKSRMTERRPHVFAFTSESNLHSQLFWKSQDFYCTQILRDFYECKNGKREHAYMFAHSLSGIEKFQFSTVNCTEVVK